MVELRIAAAVAVLALTLCAEARAQVCQASLPFKAWRLPQFGAAIGRMHGPTLDKGRTSSFGIATGNSKHFARFSVFRDRYSDYNFGDTGVGIAYGDAYQLIDRSRLVLCTEVGVDLVPTHDLEPGVPSTSSAQVLEVSARIGTVRSLGRVRGMAYVGAGSAVSRSKEVFDQGIFGTVTEISVARGWSTEAGAGALLGGRLAITGSLRWPVKVPGGFRILTIGATVGF